MDETVPPISCYEITAYRADIVRTPGPFEFEVISPKISSLSWCTAQKILEKFGIQNSSAFVKI